MKVRVKPCEELPSVTYSDKWDGVAFLPEMKRFCGAVIEVGSSADGYIGEGYFWDKDWVEVVDSDAVRLAERYHTDLLIEMAMNEPFRGILETSLADHRVRTG